MYNDEDDEKMRRNSAAVPEFKVESGNHLRIVREFIQHRALNGSDVRWGSTDYLRFNSVTVDDMERLAQHIKDAVLRELELSERGRL